MPLRDFQSSSERKTVREVLDEQIEESERFWVQVRRAAMWYLLGFFTCLLLVGCPMSPELAAQQKYIDYQDCLYRTGSYPQCDVEVGRHVYDKRFEAHR